MLCESRIPILSALLGVVGEGVAAAIVAKCRADAFVRGQHLTPGFKIVGSLAIQQQAVFHG